METQAIAEYLRLLRKNQGMTQQDVAKLCNVSTQAVSKWEKGVSIPDIASLKRLSEHYGQSINTLLDGGKKKRASKAVRQRSYALSVALVISFLAFFLRFSNQSIPGLSPSASPFFGMQIFWEGLQGWVVFLVRVQVLGMGFLLTMHILLALGVLRLRTWMRRSFNVIAMILLAIALYATALRWFFSLPQVILAASLLAVLYAYDAWPIREWRMLKAMMAHEQAESVEEHEEKNFLWYAKAATLILLSGFFLAESMARLAQMVSVVGTAVPLAFFFRSFIVYPAVFIALAVLNALALRHLRKSYAASILTLAVGVNLSFTLLFYALLAEDDRFLMVWRHPVLIGAFVLLAAGLLVQGIAKRMNLLNRT